MMRLNNNAARLAIMSIAGALVTVFVACGVGSSNQPPRARAGSISGYVVDGPIKDASVRVYVLEPNGDKGELIGTAQTNRDGYFILPSVRRSTQTPILVEVSSGSYIEDASGLSTRVNLNIKDELKAVGFYSPNAAVTLNVTPYTYIATGLAQYYLARNVGVSKSIIDANAAISRLIGDIDILATRPLRVIDAEPSATVVTKEYAYGLMTGAFSAFVRRIADMSNAVQFSGFTSIGLARLMYTDIKGDGLLDGNVVYPTGGRDSLEYGAVALNGVAYRQGLGLGALQIAKERTNSVRLSFDDLMHRAHLLAESTDAVFGTDPPLPFDNEPPVFSADPDPEILATDRAQGVVDYRINVTDAVGVHSVKVDIDGREYFKNIIPNGNRFRVQAVDFGPNAPSEHQMVVTATDMLGNVSSKTYWITLPDGKPLVTLRSTALANNAAYVAKGTYTDESGKGIRNISVAVGAGSAVDATLDTVSATWSANVTLSLNDNALTITITDNSGNTRTINRNVTLDDIEPAVSVNRNSVVEFYRNGAATGGTMASASEFSDPLYVPMDRIGYANPAAATTVLDAARIPYYALTVNDNLSAPGELKVTLNYLVNGTTVTPSRVLSAAPSNPALYVIPLIRQSLADTWYLYADTDVQELQLDIRDAAGNVMSQRLKFKAFFDLPLATVLTNVQNATANVHPLVDGEPGGEIGSCVTDSLGRCDARLLVDPQFVAQGPQYLHVTLHGGNYKEYSSQVSALLGIDEKLSSVFRFDGNDTQVVVTPYTHLGTGLLLHALTNKVAIADAYNQTVADLTAMYGFDAMTTLPADMAVLANPTTPLSNGARYISLLVGLSELTAKIGIANGTAPHTVYTSVGAAQKFYLDAKSDGLLDGVAVDANLGTVPLTLGSTALNANSYRHDIAAAALEFVSRKFALNAAQTAVLLQNAQALATNPSPKFNGAPPVAIDARQPIIAVLSAANSTSANFNLQVRVTPGTTAVASVTIGGVAATQSSPNNWSANVVLAAQGRNTVEIRVLDATGAVLATQNTDVLLDTLGPSIAITAPVLVPNQVVTAPAFTIAGTASDPSGVAAVTVTLGTQSVNAGSGNWSATLQLAGGDNTVTIAATDALGNAATQTVRVNFTANGPVITLSPPPPTRTNNNRPLISGSVNASGLTYTLTGALYRDNGGTWLLQKNYTIQPSATHSWSLDLLGGAAGTLADGNYKLTLIATNAQGKSSQSDSLFTVDATGPVLSLIAPGSLTRVIPIALTVGATDASGTVATVSVDGVAATPAGNGRWSFTSAKGAEGANSFTLRATDDLGNVSTMTATVTVDTTAPTLIVTSPANNAWVNTSAVAIVSNAQDVSNPVTITYSVNGTAVTPNAAGQIALAEGVNSVAVTATDAAGNQRTQALTVNRDMTAPQLTTVTAPPATVAVASLALRVRATDTNLSTIVASISSTGGYSGEASLDVATGVVTNVAGSGNALSFNAAINEANITLGAGSGTNNIVVRAFDRAGNVSAALTYNTLFDNLAPVGGIANSGTVSGSSVVTNQTALRIAASDISGIQNVTFTGPGAAASRVVTTAQGGVYTDTLNQSVDGTYAYTVNVNDNAGNTAPMTVSFILDRVAPVFQAIPASVAAATLTIDVTEPRLASVTLNGAAKTFTITGNTNSFTHTLVAGANSLTLVATDTAGNSASSTVTVTYTPPDTTAPTLSVPANSTVTVNSVSLSGTAGDTNPGTVTAQNTTTGGAAITATGFANWSVTVGSLQAGANTIQITARDASGNQTSKNVVVTYNAPDTTAPTLSVPANSTVTVNSVSLSGTAGDTNPGTVTAQNTTTGGAAITATGFANWSVTVGSLQAGSNTIQITARDAAGNQTSKNVVVTYNVPDTTAPTLSVPANSTVTVNSVSLSGTASDANPGTVTAKNTTTNGATLNASGFANWSVTVGSLQAGSNTIQIIARDAAGNQTSKNVVVTYNVPDTTAPTLTVPGNSTVTTNSVTLSGTASDANPGTVTAKNTTTNGTTITASGFSNWSVTVSSLQSGNNTIQITARDAVGNTTSRNVTVTYNPPTGGTGGTTGGTGGTTGGGGMSGGGGGM